MIVRTVPFLGLEWHALPDQAGSASGRHETVVRRVIPNSPAHRAGVQVGDVIHSVDGVQLSDELTLTDHIIQKKPGAVVALDLTRNDKRVHLKVVLGERQVPAQRYAPVRQSATISRE